MLELIKGFNVSDDNGILLEFIPEGSLVNITLLNGVVVEGVLTKVAKKEMQVKHDGITEVIRVSNVHEMTVAENDIEDEE